MMADMKESMDSGLEGGLELSTMAMLPSFVPTLPDGSESGEFLAMDLGGTNLRVILLKLHADSYAQEKNHSIKSHNYKVPQRAMIGTAEDLFDFIVNCLADFLSDCNMCKSRKLPLGFTFSYPCDQTSLKCAKLLRWTKGFNASGVLGNDVVELLEAAIHRNAKVNVDVVALMNDTVGTLVATGFERKWCTLGVIIGTGTNCAYMEKVKRIPKLAGNACAARFEEMIIDTEWGAFGDRDQIPYLKTKFDEMVDQRSLHPGNYSFDKLIAGMYLGEIIRFIMEKLVEAQVLFDGVGSELLSTEGSFPTKFVSEILSDASGHMYHTRQILEELGIPEYSFADMIILKELCMVVSRRSAHLAAAAIACVLNRLNVEKAMIGIDGSTYRLIPFYHSWLMDKVPQLLDNPNVQIDIVQAGDGSGKGAALVAAIAEKMAKTA